MITINFQSNVDMQKFTSQKKQTFYGMETQYPRAQAGKNIFIGTTAISETTSLYIDETALNNTSTNLISGTSRTIITFKNIGGPKSKKNCQTPDGSGTVVEFNQQTLSYTVELDAGEMTKDYAPQQIVNSICTTNIDCNMAGKCNNHTNQCICDQGWTGSTCQLINFGKARTCIRGGLCLNNTQSKSSTTGYKTTFTSSWGGGSVQDDQGNWHMYAASFGNNKDLKSWLTDSRVVHGISNTSASGPYVLSDIALGPRNASKYWDGTTQHNPMIQRDPLTGKYLLYYMGNTNVVPDTPDYHICKKLVSNNVSSVCTQRIGLATSDSPFGPWSRNDTPILLPGLTPSWDDQFTTNPTPHIFQNGSALLIYKARSKENFHTMSTGVAFAEHWSGPYKRLSMQPIDVPGTCEDAGIYHSKTMNVFRIVLHCECNYQTIWSIDGIRWNRTALPQDWCTIHNQDGSTERMSRRERPKWILDSQNKLIGLMTGVFPTESHDQDSFTMFQDIL